MLLSTSISVVDLGFKPYSTSFLADTPSTSRCGIPISNPSSSPVSQDPTLSLSSVSYTTLEYTDFQISFLLSITGIWKFSKILRADKASSLSLFCQCVSSTNVSGSKLPFSPPYNPITVLARRYNVARLVRVPKYVLTT